MKKEFLTCSLSALLFTMSSGQIFAQNTTDQWIFTLRNAYIDRNFDAAEVKDTGSWSQAASLFYKSNMIDTPLNIAEQPVKVGVDASVQYAVRLSDDKHIADSVLPFDAETKSQASDYLKHGATLKIGYDKSLFRMGELWLDVPMTSVDKSRQLQTSYWGSNLKSQINDQFQIELGRVEKMSSRNEEGFRKFSHTVNGVKYESDGLNYIDLRHQFSPNLKGEYYFGQLENLYNTHYAALEHNWIQSKFVINTKLKYFKAQENNKSLNIDAENLGILETLKINNHSLGLGYQQISGKSAYPLLDGYLPELYFINWNTAVFYKQDEKSYHLIYGYDFNNNLSGLNSILKYSYGHDFKTADGKKNTESESNVIVTYNFQQPYLKGLGMQFIWINYQVKSGNDFSENRFFVNYKRSF